MRRPLSEYTSFYPGCRYLHQCRGALQRPAGTTKKILVQSRFIGHVGSGKTVSFILNSAAVLPPMARPVSGSVPDFRKFGPYGAGYGQRPGALTEPQRFCPVPAEQC